MINLFQVLPAIVVILLIQTNAQADDYHDGYHHDHREGWHGDIRFFHGRDLDRWRRGRWYHGWHDGRRVWWWIAGGVWYPYAVPVYPYPDPYLPPEAIVPQPPVAVTPYVPIPAQSPRFWYYCQQPAGYYPYVPQCLVGWQKVPATGRQP